MLSSSQINVSPPETPILYHRKGQHFPESTTSSRYVKKEMLFWI